MNLGKHFTLSEMTVTNTGLVNSPSKIEINKLKMLVENILDPLREIYGKPITVNSGYRSPLVNKKVGGVATSEHVKGQAADITGGSKEENIKLFNLIKDNYNFRQLIDEYDYKWVHVSFDSTDNKKQIIHKK